MLLQLLGEMHALSNTFAEIVSQRKCLELLRRGRLFHPPELPRRLLQAEVTADRRRALALALAPSPAQAPLLLLPAEHG